MAAAGHHHIATQKSNLTILGLLFLCTVLTVWAPQWGLGHFLGPLFAFIIASTKAYMVLAYFMHLKYDDRTNLIIIASTVFFLLLLAAITVLDIVTRVSESSPL